MGTNHSNFQFARTYIFSAGGWRVPGGTYVKKIKVQNSKMQPVWGFLMYAVEYKKTRTTGISAPPSGSRVSNGMGLCGVKVPNGKTPGDDAYAGTVKKIAAIEYRSTRTDVRT